jgi:hypothetical protein
MHMESTGRWNDIGSSTMNLQISLAGRLDRPVVLAWKAPE